MQRHRDAVVLGCGGTGMRWHGDDQKMETSGHNQPPYPTNSTADLVKFLARRGAGKASQPASDQDPELELWRFS